MDGVAIVYLAQDLFEVLGIAGVEAPCKVSFSLYFFASDTALPQLDMDGRRAVSLS